MTTFYVIRLGFFNFRVLEAHPDGSGFTNWGRCWTKIGATARSLRLGADKVYYRRSF